nr:MAG: DUF2254 domain-containing protein [Candidatus Methanoperedens sp.]
MVRSYRRVVGYLLTFALFLILFYYITILKPSIITSLIGFFSVKNIVSDIIILILTILITIVLGLIIYGFLLSKIENQSYISYLWIERTLFYLITCIIIIFLSYRILYSFNFLHTQVDSAQYMISSLIQSEAAIIAILITLTLIAVQQSASSFSTRVIDIFKYGNPDFWIILIIYIGSIIYGLGVLKLIGGTGSDPSTLESSIFLSYSIGIFSLIALIPYMWNTLDLLKPLKMIETLSKKISTENMSTAVGHKLIDPEGNPILEAISYIFSTEIKTKSIIEAEDPIQPVIDIISRSLINHDYETARQGFEIIQKSINDNIINRGYYNRSVFESILTKLVIDLTNFTKLAIKIDEDNLVLKILAMFSDIQKITDDLLMSDALNIVAESLRKIRNQSVGQNMQSVEFETLKLLKQIRDIGDYKSYYMKNARLIACDALLDANPKDIISLSKKADILLMRNQIEEASKAYDKILELNPKDTDILYKKGFLLFFRFKKDEEALKTFDKLLEIKPNDFLTLFVSIKVLTHLERYEEVLIACSKASEINPKDAEIWDYRGLAFAKLGRNEEARKSFQIAQEIRSIK